MTILVTGGTGIGGAVAAALRARSADVVTISRTGDIPADLTLLADTARAAAQAPPRLDAIVCCAGNLSTVAEHTPEGLERTLALNYLSRYVLIRHLLPRLAPTGRIVLVANAGKYPDTLDLTDLNLRAGGRGLWVSGRTQFANDLLAVALAARTGLAVSCVFPGLVATRVFRDARGAPRALRAVAAAVQRVAGTDPARAAETPARLALDAGLPGGFYGPGCRPLRVPARVSQERAAALWAASEELTRPWLDAAARP
jgi:NAD(P)-dependent dehydrogenase (short-subunit alcohol dehydrogenase family)